MSSIWPFLSIRQTVDESNQSVRRITWVYSKPFTVYPAYSSDWLIRFNLNKIESQDVFDEFSAIISPKTIIFIFWNFLTFHLNSSFWTTFTSLFLMLDLKVPIRVVNSQCLFEDQSSKTIIFVIIPNVKNEIDIYGLWMKRVQSVNPYLNLVLNTV